MTKSEAIKALKELAIREPDKYDITKLNDAIQMVNDTNDIDALLILGKPQCAMVRDNFYHLEDCEIADMKTAIENCGFEVKEVKHLEPDNDRDDWAFVINDEDKKVVWISKMLPLFDDNPYTLLAVGLNFPSESFKTMEELIGRTKYLLKE